MTGVLGKAVAATGNAPATARPPVAELRCLTGLRGIAATAVMLDHYAALDFAAPFPLDMMPHMYLAVDMFMLLSGFILAMNYEDLLRRGSIAATYRTFLWRRVARLYPVYALLTVVCFVLCRGGWLFFLHPDASFAALLANLLAVQTWIWPGSSLDGPGWSISAEWFANLAFPLLLPVVLGRSAAKAATVHGAAWIVLALTALLFGELFDIPSSGAVNVISGPEALGRCVSEFAIGMVCWRLRSRAAWVRHLAGDRVQVVLVLGLALLMQSTRLDLAFVAGCALLLMGLSWESSALSALLRSRPLLFLGRVSFSLYLIHIALLPLRDALEALLGQAGVPGARWVAVLCCAACTVALAAVSRRLVERPAQRWLLHRLRPI